MLWLCWWSFMQSLTSWVKNTGPGGCRSKVPGEPLQHQAAYQVWGIIWKALSQDTCRAKTRHPTKTGACGDILVRAKPPMGLEWCQKPHTHSRKHMVKLVQSLITPTLMQTHRACKQHNTSWGRRKGAVRQKESTRSEEILCLQPEWKLWSTLFLMCKVCTNMSASHSGWPPSYN